MKGIKTNSLALKLPTLLKKIKLLQPFLIDRIISILNIDTNDYVLEINAKSTRVGKPLLHKDLSGKPRKET